MNKFCCGDGSECPIPNILKTLKHRDSYIYMPCSHDGAIFQHGWIVYKVFCAPRKVRDCVKLVGLLTQDSGSCYWRR